MNRFLLAILLTVSATASASPARIVNARDYGAVGDGAADDRPAIQAALDAAGDGYTVLPAGRYRVTQAPGRFWSLLPHTGGALVGDGAGRTVIIAADGTAGSVRTVEIDGTDITVQGLTILGGAQATRDEHRAAVFVRGDRARILDVEASGFTGDGFYLYSGAGAQLIGVAARDNLRNGMTLGGRVDNALIRSSVFERNRVQQIDHEPGGTYVAGTVISDCAINGTPGSYAVTLAGGQFTPSRDLTLVGNRINGGVEIVWATGVTLVGNAITSVDVPPVTLYRTTGAVTIDRNALTYAGTANFGTVVLDMGTTGEASTGTRIIGNTITNTNPHGLGVRADGPTDITIDGNTFAGAGVAVPGYSAIALRTTVPGRDVIRATVVGNAIAGFGDAGVAVSGNGAAVFRELEVTRNMFARLRRDAVFDDGLHELQTLAARGNTWSGAAPAVPATVLLLGSAL